jgi:CheY-like chemotaxis protein
MEQNDHEFVFSIDDSGPGLSEMDINNVFEKYWSGSASQFSGTGLGLFICKTIVEAHGGRIFVENISSGGARFKFSIPRDVPSLQIYSSSIVDARNDQRKKIYIVDDDEDLREVISWALSKEGYSIHSFKSPGEALQSLLKERHIPDLIVVDFHMDEMKGSEFIFRKNHIRSAKNCPVVMISASPQEVEKEVPREFYEEIITKPIDLEGLVNNVKKFLQ